MSVKANINAGLQKIFNGAKKATLGNDAQAKAMAQNFKNASYLNKRLKNVGELADKNGNIASDMLNKAEKRSVVERMMKNDMGDTLSKAQKNKQFNVGDVKSALRGQRNTEVADGVGNFLMSGSSSQVAGKFGAMSVGGAMAANKVANDRRRPYI